MIASSSLKCINKVLSFHKLRALKVSTVQNHHMKGCFDTNKAIYTSLSFYKFFIKPLNNIEDIQSKGSLIDATLKLDILNSRYQSLI
jgi:hypothetical protein